MPATSKHQKTDASDRLPVPQHHNAQRDEFEARHGAGGAARTVTPDGASEALGSTSDAPGANTVVGQLKHMAQHIQEATEGLSNG